MSLDRHGLRALRVWRTWTRRPPHLRACAEPPPLTRSSLHLVSTAGQPCCSAKRRAEEGTTGGWVVLLNRKVHRSTIRTRMMMRRRRSLCHAAREVPCPTPRRLRTGQADRRGVPGWVRGHARAVPVPAAQDRPPVNAAPVRWVTPILWRRPINGLIWSRQCHQPPRGPLDHTPQARAPPAVGTAHPGPLAPRKTSRWRARVSADTGVPGCAWRMRRRPRPETRRTATHPESYTSDEDSSSDDEGSGTLRHSKRGEPHDLDLWPSANRLLGDLVTVVTGGMDEVFIHSFVPSCFWLYCNVCQTFLCNMQRENRLQDRQGGKFLSGLDFWIVLYSTNEISINFTEILVIFSMSNSSLPCRACVSFQRLRNIKQTCLFSLHFFHYNFILSKSHEHFHQLTLAM